MGLEGFGESAFFSFLDGKDEIKGKIDDL